MIIAAAIVDVYTIVQMKIINGWISKIKREKDRRIKKNKRVLKSI